MFKYHLLALLTGIFLDLIIGDPHGIWHPVVTIGKWISFLDKKLLKREDLDDKSKKKRGFALVILVILPVALITSTLMLLCWKFHPVLGFIVEAILSCYCLCAKSLLIESSKVIKAYEKNGIEEARNALSMIVGRDTKNLDLNGILRATVETVAENSSDGIIAPMFYLIIGGPILGIIYKAVNTMDSMVGYHNDRYEYFGYAAAKLDDIANFLPARISGLLAVIGSTEHFGAFNRKNAWKIFLRDRYNHKSPNSAQSEAAFAGALSIRLGGPSYYFGKLVDKPYIGDDIKEIEIRDVEKSHQLLLNMEWLSVLFIVILLVFLFVLT